MNDLYWLTDEQMARLSPYFPKSHAKPRVDDRWVLSVIIFVNQNGLRWRDEPREYGPHKVLYNRWKRWSEVGVFTRMMEGLSAQRAEPQTVMIDATYLKTHGTASNLEIKKGPIYSWPRSDYRPFRGLNLRPALRNTRTGSLNLLVQALPIHMFLSIHSLHPQ
jgi:transposase